jgi:uncharacterized protein (DUF1778 family)
MCGGTGDVFILSEEAFLKMQALIDDPPKANQRMKAAAARVKKSVP